MEEPRKIVVILGNGFDLDLGLKTSYKSFWESKYCPKDYPSPLISYLNSSLGQTIDDVRWYDLENAFLKYANIVNQPLHFNSDLLDSDIKFLKEFDPNSPERAYYFEYSREIDNLLKKGYIFQNPKNGKELLIPYQDDMFHDSLWRDERALNLIKERLCEYLRSEDKPITERRTVASQLLLAMSQSVKSGDTVSIYTFNYTRVQLHGYSIDDIPVHYMHGNCADGRIIVGTRDDLNIGRGYDFLQKAMDDFFSPPDIVTGLKEADEVIIFGHSMGENDYQYFAPFFLKQASYDNPTRKDIVFFTRDYKSQRDLKRSLQKMTGGHLSALYSINQPKIIKTGNIEDDQYLLLDFFLTHHTEKHYAEKIIGELTHK